MRVLVLPRIMQEDMTKKAEEKPVAAEKEQYRETLAAQAKPQDWPFMEQSGKVLENHPATWDAYPDTEEGMIGILKMEYGEFAKATTVKDRMHELVHVASACLLLWRYYYESSKSE